ncbi:MAG: N-acetylmuramoyl-L-alanine amidase, partial [Candidatus Pacebacteria bacterium]|nr:N-acetylmuramoyl-L-alanine amidase [Candidatus Paceibacterota bacterium]
YHGVQFGDTIITASPVPAEPARKVRILIMPGHQPDKGGTIFGGVYEREVVMDIAEALSALLLQNSHYEVLIARTKTAWNPILQTYFDTHALEIETFQQSQKLQMAGYLADGSIVPDANQVYHNTASPNAALKLYGINKWASDNNYDIVLHLHINDETGHRAHVAGKDTGFSVYVPDHQYSNAAASKTVGEAIAVRLNAYHATSTLPKEDRGVVEDQELIAVGSNNTVNGAALLIEYGYIYEPQFQNASVRRVALADYAYQTYLGLQDFFHDPISPSYGSISFPYDWTKVSVTLNERNPGVYGLQAALHHLGYYPPTGKSFSECPISGAAGPCTRRALQAYQRARGVEATGTFGPRTVAELFRDTERPSTAAASL